MNISDGIDTAYRNLERAICSFERATSRNYTLALIPHNETEPVRLSLDGKPVTLSSGTSPEQVIALAFGERNRTKKSKGVLADPYRPFADAIRAGCPMSVVKHRGMLGAPDFALLSGCDLKSLHNYVDQGKVTAITTPGGHLRFFPAVVVAYLHKYGMPAPIWLEVLAAMPEIAAKPGVSTGPAAVAPHR